MLVCFYLFFAKRIQCFTASNSLTHVFDFWCVSVFLFAFFICSFVFFNIIIVQFVLVLCTLHTAHQIIVKSFQICSFSLRIWSEHLIYNGRRMKRLSCCTFLLVYSVYCLLLCRFPKWIDILIEIGNSIYIRDFLGTICIRSTRYACYLAIFIAFESDFCYSPFI